MLNFTFLEKIVELVSPSHFVYEFVYVYFLLTDQTSLINFTSQDIGQYMYYNRLLTRV